jgi:hypothetical protein
MYLVRGLEDREVAGVIQQLGSSDKLVQALCRMRFPWMSRVLPENLVRRMMAKDFKDISSVKDFQGVLCKYVRYLMKSTSDGLSCSGLENIAKNGVGKIFVSNHRDIVLDSVLIGYQMYTSGHGFTRAGFGSNLASVPEVAAILRLSGGFIVPRGVKGRALYDAMHEVSSYIDDVVKQGGLVWIAQREGRSKDGVDETNPAVIKTLHLSSKDSFSLDGFVNSREIIPVAVSYEWEPCDMMKSNEVYVTKKTGKYTKSKGEDEAAMLAGLLGKKGRVNLAFGKPLSGNFADYEGVASAIDNQIHDLYHVWPSNVAAVFMLRGERIDGCEELEKRLQGMPAESREYLLKLYANPVQRKFIPQQEKVVSQLPPS